MKKISRKAFLAGSLCVPFAPALPKPAPKASAKKGSSVKLGISSYSYWHFRPPKVTIEQVIEKTSALGVPGVDILHRQMDGEDPAYLRKLKRHAFLNGVDLICLSIHQDFVSPDAASRKKNIEHTKKCIRLAHEMGIPSIRLNSGRWGTARDFNHLMELRGKEPILPGHTEDEGFKWCIDSIEECLPEAEKHGVHLALENHWGLTRTPEGLLRIAKRSTLPGWASSWTPEILWRTPTTSSRKSLPSPPSCKPRPISEAVNGTPSTSIIRASPRSCPKSATTDSIEFEGKAPAGKGVPQSVELLRRAFS